MKKIVLHSMMMVILVLLTTGCGGSSSGSQGASGSDGLTQQSVEASGTNCIYGGTRVDLGIDSDGDGNLSSSEITQTTYVCNDHNMSDSSDGGNSGVDGVDGANALILQSIEESGANCSGGGIRIDSGIDSNRDGNLSSEEITQTSYLCNTGSGGSDGSSNGVDGVDGSNALILQSVEGRGANCSSGGIRVDSGIDSNEDGDLSTSEITQTSYVCNGSSGSNGSDGSDGEDSVDGVDGSSALISQSIETNGSNCPYGGIRIDSGIDSNSDGNLSSDEIIQTSYVCNGINGSDGVDGNGMDGVDGSSALISQSIEANGSNCIKGGIRIDSGIDRNSDGDLSLDEITQTSYICDGNNGVDGVDGGEGNSSLNALVLQSIEANGSNCAYGGIRIDSGVDSNSDGTLSSVEIMQTSYVCNGSDGNSVPFADAGADADIENSTLYTLDGTGSSDANGDTLTYSWSIVSQPTGSDLALSGATSATPSFTAVEAGEYVFALVVNDGALNSVADEVTITVANPAVMGSVSFGALAGATVTIYKVEDNGSLSELWSETTSSGATLAEIGQFNTHAYDLDDDSFYLYKVVGGEDWDVDDDGSLDAMSTANKGTIRAIAQGSDIKSAGEDFKVTAMSEILYEKVLYSLKNDYDADTFEGTLTTQAATVIETDISGDGTIDNLDILLYNPASDSSNLTEYYRAKNQEILDAIHQGSAPIVALLPTLGSYDTSGHSEHVTLSSDESKAFLADGSAGISIFDISDIENPTLLGSYDTNISYAQHITLSSDETRAYISDQITGVVVLDISDPANPSLVTTITYSGSYLFPMQSVLSSDESRLYIADSANDLVIMDISDESNITQLGSYTLSGSLRALKLSSDTTRLYAASSSGLYLLNISDPTNPYTMAQLYSGSSLDVVLSSDESIAYIGGSGGVTIVDISNAFSPVVLGVYATDTSVKKLALSDDENYLYLANYSSGLVVLDVTDKTAPSKYAQYQGGSDTYGVVLSSDNSRAFLAQKIVGLEIVSTDAVSLDASQVSSYALSTNAVKAALSNDESTIFLAGLYGGFLIADVSDSSNPSEISSYATSWAYDVKLSADGSKAFVADDDGLFIFDVSDLNNPTLLGSYASTDWVYGVVLSDDESKAYLAQDDGVAIVNISDVSNPTLLGYYSTSDSSYKVVLSNDESKAYIGNGYGLIVLDINNSASPSELASFATDEYSYTLAISSDETKAYIGSDNEMVAVDISDIYSMSKIASFTANLGGQSVYDVVLSADESKAYLAADYAGLIVVDISDPNDMSQVARYGVGDFVEGFALSADESKAYILGGDLTIVDLDSYQ